MRRLVLCAVGTLLLAAGSAWGQQVWSGTWHETRGAQGGRLELTIGPRGEMNGTVTNGAVAGTWNGFMSDDGRLFATYVYPGLGGARAVGRVLRHDAGQLAGKVVFLNGNVPFAQGDFQLRRLPYPDVNNGPRPDNPRAGQYPFTGNGMFVYCGAASVCGRRGANALPGNWGWTGGLFGDIKRNYPQVWCNLYPGSC
ncbi:MAG TPA: hypothetical protein VJ779_12595 [Acetobacteraceae bacterium]|nr:hypothetical protein [Acetobacteraceae bacterium]